MERATRRWVIAALLVGAAFWARLLLSFATRTPARDVVFFDAQGSVVDRPYCHGSAVVDGAHVFQLCHPSIGAGGVLTRFDLARGRADMLWPNDRATLLTVFAKGGDGAPLVAFNPGADATLYRARPEGGLQEVARFALGIAAVASVGDRVEVVEGYFGPTALHVREAGVWTKHDLTRVAAAPGEWLKLIGVERHDGRFRAVYLRGAAVEGTPRDADVLVGPIGNPPQKVATIALRDPDARVHDGYATFIRPQLIVGASSVLFYGLISSETLPAEWSENRIAVGDAPSATNLVSFDYVAHADRLEPIVQLDSSTAATRIRGEWITAAGSERLTLRRLRDGRTSSPVDRSWVTPGYKLLPAADGGHWMMGALGDSYLHLDKELARTDTLGFVARFRRMYRRDRAKDSDVANPATYAAVSWALFPPLAIGAAAFFISRRRAARHEFALVYTSAVYLVVMLVAAWSAWRLVSRF